MFLLLISALGNDRRKGKVIEREKKVLAVATCASLMTSLMHFWIFQFLFSLPKLVFIIYGGQAFWEKLHQAATSTHIQTRSHILAADVM